MPNHTETLERLRDTFKTKVLDAKIAMQRVMGSDSEPSFFVVNAEGLELLKVLYRTSIDWGRGLPTWWYGMQFVYDDREAIRFQISYSETPNGSGLPVPSLGIENELVSAGILTRDRQERPQLRVEESEIPTAFLEVRVPRMAAAIREHIDPESLNIEERVQRALAREMDRLEEHVQSSVKTRVEQEVASIVAEAIRMMRDSREFKRMVSQQLLLALDTIASEWDGE